MNSIWLYDQKGELVTTNAGTIASPNLEAITQTNPSRMTFIAVFPGNHRASGIYEYRTARAHVDERSDKRGYPENVLDLAFVKIEDGQKLYELIRSGKMAPTISFGEKQVPAPLRNLKDLAKEAWGIIRRNVTAHCYLLSQ